MRGLYLAQRDTLVRAIRDPELEHRHRVVLAEIVIATNSKTGMAFPGYAAIAQATGYSPTTVANTISQLKSWGYLASIKQAAEPGGRALAHYTVVKPTIEQLQAAITAHIEELRKEQWKRNPGFVPPDYKPQELTVRGAG